MRKSSQDTAKTPNTTNTATSKKSISLVFVALFVVLVSAVFQPSYAIVQANQQNLAQQNLTQPSTISQESLKNDTQKDSIQQDSPQSQKQLQTQKNSEDKSSQAKNGKKDIRFFGYIPREYVNLFSNSAHFFPAIALGYTLIIKDFIGFRQQALGYIAVVGATYAVKYSLYFASPYAKDTLSFAKRPTSESYEAFPSGHTASAFAAVGFVAKRYGAKLGIAAFILAAAVGESRILLEKHTILQVICGGILGFLLSFFCASPFRRVSTPSILPTYKNKTLYSVLVLLLL